MNKIFSFLAGAFCGAIVGATAALLMTPASGQQLREDALSRLEYAIEEARTAMEERSQELQAQFEQMKEGTQ